MKLVKAHITEFQSIHDSTEFEVGDVTCLVGKNEAGKTALLKALYRLNPVIDSDGKFDVTDDYPRQAVSDYEDAVEAGSEQAQVVHATYAFGADDITAVQEIYGPKCLKDENPTLVLHKGYSNDISFTELNVNSEAAIEHLIKTAGLPQPLADQVIGLSSVKEMVDLLSNAESTDAVHKLTPKLQEISEHDVAYVVYSQIIRPRVPKFLYFDEYFRLS